MKPFLAKPIGAPVASMLMTAHSAVAINVSESHHRREP